MSEEYEYPKGGEEGYEGDGPNLRYDEFVGRIVQDPNEPPNVTLLSGYLGSSSEEGHVRLYLDEELSRYVEIPEKAVLHSQELPPEQSPLGGSLIWIDRDAEVLHGAAGSERSRATFLEGQIAQDYMGGGRVPYYASGGTTTQTRECIYHPTSVGPNCGASHLNPCIPKTEVLTCRTRTGIFCTRLGPNCGRTSYDPVCTIAGQHCFTVIAQQCQSIYNICVTQNESYCVASGAAPCYPTIDPTIWQEQTGPQVFERRFGGGGGVGGFDPTAGIFQTGFNCPSVFDNCATQESFCPTQSACPSRLVVCQSQFGGCVTHIGCPSRVIRCQTLDINCLTRVGPRCLVSQVAICTDTQAGCQFESAVCAIDQGGLVAERAAIPPSRLVAACFTRYPNQCQYETAVRCVSRVFRCPTVSDPRCFASQVAICPDTRAGCQFESAACGVDPAGGGIAQQFQARVNVPGVSQSRDCQTQNPECHPTGVTYHPGCDAVALQPTRFCPSQVLTCPTRYACPSRFTPCQSQLIRCPSAIDACPTRYNCPTMPNGCPGYTQFGTCETYGPCPSAVDACPSRFGCYETAACGESIACNPGGGFGGGGFGGAGGGGFGGFGG